MSHSCIKVSKKNDYDKLDAAYKELEDSLDFSLKALNTLSNLEKNMNQAAGEMNNVADVTSEEINKLREAVQLATRNYENDIKELKDYADQTRADAENTVDIEQQVNDEIQDIKQIIDELEDEGEGELEGEYEKKNTKRRKRKTRHNQNSERIHFRHIRSPDDQGQETSESTIARLEKLLNDTIKLEEDIETYRDESTGVAFKTYLDALHFAQSQPSLPTENSEIRKKYSDLCENCTDDMSLEDVETEIETEIENLKNQAKSMSKEIFKCIGDKCWQENIHGGDTRPPNC